MAISKVEQAGLTYDHSNDDKLTAVNEAIWHINEAMDELRGMGEYEDWFGQLSDMYDAMEAEQDDLESYQSGEYQAMIAEQRRDYERDLLW